MKVALISSTMVGAGAESMKKLQPQMEVIKKKYPDDKERQNAEVMPMM